MKDVRHRGSEVLMGRALRHGVLTYPSRQQPYTVWFRGRVIRFCETMGEAMAAMEAERKLLRSR